MNYIDLGDVMKIYEILNKTIWEIDVRKIYKAWDIAFVGSIIIGILIGLRLFMIEG